MRQKCKTEESRQGSQLEPRCGERVGDGVPEWSQGDFNQDRVIEMPRRPFRKDEKHGRVSHTHHKRIC